MAHYWRNAIGLTVGLAALGLAGGCGSDEPGQGTGPLAPCQPGQTLNCTPTTPVAPSAYQVGDDVDLDNDGVPDGKAIDTNGDNIADSVDTDGDGDADAPLPGSTTGDVTTPLPCDVQTLLVEKCGDCHGSTQYYGAPMALMTWDNLQAEAGKSPVVSTTGLKEYEAVLQRVADDAHPMPPAPYQRLSAQEIQVLQSWVSAGAPVRAAGATCDTDTVVTPVGDGDGDVGGGDGDAGAGNPDGPPFWGVEQSGGPEDCETYYELRAHGGTGEHDKTPYMARSTGENEGNQYYCFYFEPPYDLEDQGLWFAPIIDNKTILHHWLLYGNDLPANASGTSGPCSAAEPGSYLLAGWAPGAPETSYPADVGIQMPRTGSAGLILEVHYFNPTGQPQGDRSGVKLCTAPKGTRKNLAAVHFTGGENICIQPNASYKDDPFNNGQTKTVGTCDPATGEDIHLINVWPHMHKAGRHMKVVINRAGGAKEVIHDEDFDFNSQITYALDDIVLKPGDTMDTECWYENETNAQIPFGENTQREMCYGFVTAWPAGSLVYGGSEISPLGATQPANRCLDPLGILSSCNGLGDWPIVPK